MECICKNEDYKHQFKCGACGETGVASNLSEWMRSTLCPQRNHCPMTICGYQKPVCDDCKSIGVYSTHGNGGKGGYNQQIGNSYRPFVPEKKNKDLQKLRKLSDEIDKELGLQEATIVGHEAQKGKSLTSENFPKHESEIVTMSDATYDEFRDMLDNDK